MEKFIFTADLHLKNWNDTRFNKYGTPLRVEEILNTIHQMCQYAIDNYIHTFIIGGDINHTKNILDAHVFSLFKDVLNQYSNLDIYIIPGNHDKTKELNITSAVDILSGPEHIHIIKEPKTIENITFIPYRNSIVQDIKDSTGGDILISHVGLSDGNYTNTTMAHNSSLSSKDFKKWKLTLLGDYHMPQSLKNNVYYVGSPIQFTRSEAGEEKRFLEVDCNTFKIKSIPTIGYRKYVNIIIEKNSDFKQLVKDINILKETDDFVIIRNNNATIPEDLIETVEDCVVVEQYLPDHQIRGITTDMKLSEQADKYLEIMNIKDIMKYKNIFNIVINNMESF